MPNSKIFRLLSWCKALMSDGEKVEAAAGGRDGVAAALLCGDRLAAPVRFKRFELQRITDVTGVSGVGIVAQGVQFSDGRVALRWRVPNVPSSTVVWDCVEDAIAVHGHDGNTTVEWID